MGFLKSFYNEVLIFLGARKAEMPPPPLPPEPPAPPPAPPKRTRRVKAGQPSKE